MRGVLLPGAGSRFVPIREIDYRALRLLTQRAEEGSPLKRDLALRRLDKAWKQGRLGYPESEPTDWQWRMCEARMMLGCYDEWRGWEYRSEWSAGLWHNPQGSWQGKYVDVLHVFGEQGIGDEVCFSQVLADVKPLVGKILLETDPRLVDVLGRSLGIETRSAEFRDGKRYFNRVEGAWIPLGDVLRRFRERLSDFKRKPYLLPKPEEVWKWRAYKGRTGVSWRGAQGSYNWMTLSGLVEEPLSLQYDQGWDEDVAVPDGLDMRNDIEGLMGLLGNLDRVLTVSTSVAHFAAAMGVRVDLILAPLNGIRKNLLPFKWHCEPMFGRTPWYGDNVRVFRDLDAYRNHRKD